MTFQINHIVVVDDDPDNIKLFQSAVAETCHHLSLNVVTDGTELMTFLVNTEAPDAILMDLSKVGKSGNDCLEDIRSSEKFDDVPVLMLSTSDRKSEINHCLTHGADHYSVKPNTYEGLKNIMKNLCEGKLSTRRPLYSIRKKGSE